ncbi:hypothetical protein IW261DRAFT_1556940 [Armillaria novae-zelandiae]|uniref:Uncharacterized protein n=1 Tax=Armillaria novae-zelandiae TaxID=153914 RepID=A0AA39PQE7_9AGAR|nr:hypothetical protein IW261DRAFT_1556940 [Armillaria novae-zelandiae]
MTIMKETIQRQIISLEVLEKALADRYGMVAHFDSVQILDEAKRRAFAKRGPTFDEDLRALDQLNDLRLQLAQLHYSRAATCKCKRRVEPLQSYLAG